MKPRRWEGRDRRSGGKEDNEGRGDKATGQLIAADDWSVRDEESKRKYREAVRNIGEGGWRK